MESVNLLSLDGGGVRGVCELLILHEIMSRIQSRLKLPESPRPCDYFHLIGGTSTGGLIALMLGRLRMTTNEALIAYNSIAEAIFGKANQKPIQKDGMFKATTLETKIKEVVARKELGEQMLEDTSDAVSSKAFVCAVPANNVAHPRLFRTYQVQENNTYNGMIWEAARATTAAPPFFKRIAIGESGRTKEEFLDGGLRFNNPAYQVMYEARSIFGDTPKLGCLRLLPSKLINLLKRIATDCEETAHKFAQQFQDIPDFYFRYNVTHGAGNISLEEWKKMADLETHTKAYMQEVSVSKSIDALVKILCQWKNGNANVNATASKITLRSLCITVPELATKSTSQVSMKRQPMSSDFFTGRTDILSKLENFFEARGPGCHDRREFLLYGMGGAGKTQIALKFVEKNRSRFQKVFWVDASNKETLEQSYKDIALKIDANFDTKSSLQAALQQLEGFENEWLLLFDGADDIESISGLWPPGCQGNILFTSRNHMLRRLRTGSIYKVDEMSEDDAVALLLAASRLKDSKETYQDIASSIVKELGFLALAVDQAGAYIANGQCSIQDFLMTFQLHRRELLQLDAYKGASSYDQAVYATWELSYNAISKATSSNNEGSPIDQSAKAALQILNIFAFFHYENIWEDIFKFAAENWTRFLPYDQDIDPESELEDFEYLPQNLLLLGPNKIWDSQSFRQGIRTLLSYSLITQDTSSRSFSMHRLVHGWSHDRLTQKEKQILLPISWRTLASSIVFGQSDEDYTFRRNLLPHITTLIAQKASLPCKTTAGEMSRISLVFQEAGRWTEAEKLKVEVLEIRTRTLGPEHSDTLISMGNLASIYSDQGRWTEAEKLRVEVLEIGTRILGPEHPDTLINMNNLASTYSHQGRWAEAEKLEVEVLELGTRILGPEHPKTLTSMNNLASTYLDQGRWAEAEKLWVEVLEIGTRTLGPEHPNTLTSMSNLVSTYSHRGRWTEAEKLGAEVLKIRTRILGPEHPDTLISMNNLASTYRGQGRWTEAEKLGVEVLEIGTRILEPEHPLTLTSMNNIAVTYLMQGRREEAVEILRRLVEIRARVQGLTHPDSLESMNYLAFVLMLPSVEH